eukprot:GEMP01028051.1.p1 GENE.GEMP01028051.1~~GEMP01028051.1.p1  ORF type:complete len:548 (+),score=139.09 GEMP01028051.1:29-1672(+)
MGGVLPALRRKMGKVESEPNWKRHRIVAPERLYVQNTHETWRRPLSKEERRKKLRDEAIRKERDEKERKKQTPIPPTGPRPHVTPDANGVRSDFEDPEKDHGRMASVVQDLWETLMSNQAEHLKAIGGDLFSMEAKKQQVQTAQRKMAEAEKDSELAREKMTETKNEFKELCARLIQAGSGELYRTWRVGELCFRKGVLCTIEQVHYNEDPAYFEVQPVFEPKTIVGTEASVMLVPAPFQQGCLRQKLRAVDAITGKFKDVEAKLALARVALQDSHEQLVTAHELAVIEGENDDEPEIWSAPVDVSGAPPGMPDMALVQKWTGPLSEIPEEEATTWDATMGSDEYGQYTTEDGEVYFCCMASGETTWVLPPGARLVRDETDDFMRTQRSAFGETYADLSFQANQQEAEREAWNKWYHEYTAWYQANLPESEARQYGQAEQAEAGAQATGAREQPKPAPPEPETAPKAKLLPPSVHSFKDRATRALVVAIQKEMSSMLERQAPLSERRQALRELHRQWHPDKNPDKMEVAKSIFQFVEECKAWFLDES